MLQVSIGKSLGLILKRWDIGELYPIRTLLRNNNYNNKENTQPLH